MKRILFVILALAILSGCASNAPFAFKPSPPAAGGRQLPVKLAVLPFTDATEDFTQRGSVLHPENLSYNLAKTGIKGSIDALTPAYWAKAFADETAASGDFRSVRFLYAASELSDEDYRIEGTVEKATVKGGELPNEFAIRLRAYRSSGREPAWEKQVSRRWKATTADLLAECGKRDAGCWRDRHRRDLDRAMREMFSEARADLVRVLAPVAGGAAPDGGQVASPPTDTEPVDETIEGILKGKR